jgi:hypothetical protein
MWELLTGEEPYASMHYGAIIGLFSYLRYFSLIDKCMDNDCVTVIIYCWFSSCILYLFALHFCFKMSFHLIA